MADIFISFRTDDTPRVQPVYDAFRARGLSVFWSNDIPDGAARYQAIIIEEIRKASLVVVLWTHASVKSHAVAQECSQATRDNKLFQMVLDDIEPIEFPMEAVFTAQKTMLVGWTGDTGHRGWVKLNEAIDARLGRPTTASPPVSIPRSQPTPPPLPSSTTDRLKPAAPAVGKPFKDIDIGPELVAVPAGSFMMGEANAQRKVTIGKPLAVGRFPVTFAEWDAAGLPHKPGDQGWGRGKRPVINVNWDDANAYAAWLAKKTGKPYRLLTEAEWEYCCRAGTTTTYAFGDTITTSQAQFSAEQTVEVGTFPPNAWGVYDMHGNVWEWCQDVWHDTYDGAPTDGSAWLQDGDGSRRVVRGGSWFNDPQGLRSANRDGFTSDGRVSFLSFRLARTLNP